MHPELFAQYNSLYESISQVLGAWILAAVLIALASLPLTALVSEQSVRVRAQACALSIGLALIILGSYYFPPSEGFRLFALASGSALICLYGFVWGFSEIQSAKRAPRADVLACVVIAVTTLLKLAYLQEWPLVLTDYAATTGAITIERYFYNGQPWHKIIPKSFLEGGGASFLHAPLLALAFKIFDYSTFSVRFAEVIPSIGSLIFLWLWLRVSLSPGWALIGLSLFAFSAEHLSQSRMGTFYSTSQCVAFAALWLWAALKKRSAPRSPYIIGLVLVNLAVLGCYRPTQVVWILSLVIPALSFARGRISRKGVVVVVGLSVLLTFSVYYAIYEPFLMAHLTLRKWMLATDAPIWQKNLQDEVTKIIQPPTIIFANFIRNVWRVVVASTDHSAVKDAIYQPFSAIAMIFAFGGLLSRRWGTASLLLLIGMLPSLTTFPIDRRNLLMRPLIPLSVMLMAHEWLTLSRVLFKRISLKVLAQTLCGTALLLLPLQGIYRLTRYNGPIGVGPSFGPEYVYDMIVQLQSISKEHSLVIVNPGLGVDKFYMAFARDIYGTAPSSQRVRMVTIRPQDGASALPTSPLPTVYAVLNEDDRAWTVPWLQAHVPNIKITAYKKDHRTLYWLGVASNPS